jgi:hypothetical protein
LLKNEILSGEIPALEVELVLKSMEEVIKKTRGDKYVKEAVMREADKWSEKTFEYKGINVTKSQRTTFDFSGCGDEVYNDLIRQQETLKAQIKAREAMLKTGVNTDTGETYDPPKTSTTEFLTIKFKGE